MKKTAIMSILPYLKDSKIIGMGSTSICFLIKGNNVLKLFMDTNNKKKLFDSKEDIIAHFDRLSEVNNDTYLAPDELLIKDNQCIAYIYRYKNAHSFKNLKGSTKLDRIVQAYGKLVEDTHKISEKKLVLNDMHDKNMLFSYMFYIIDLDYGYFVDSKNPDDLTNFNLIKMNDVIIHSLFKQNYNKVIEFYNNDLNELYKASTKSDYKKFKIFLQELQKYDDINKKSDLLKKRLIHTHDNYYKFD